MVSVPGYFNYRPDVITSTGQRKPSGFGGNSITGEIPIAIWDSPSEAYRLLDVAPEPRITAPTVRQDTAPAVYTEPNPVESKTPKMLMAVGLPLMVVVIVGTFIFMRFKRG